MRKVVEAETVRPAVTLQVETVLEAILAVAIVREVALSQAVEMMLAVTHQEAIARVVVLSPAAAIRREVMVLTLVVEMAAHQAAAIRQVEILDREVIQEEEEISPVVETRQAAEATNLSLPHPRQNP